MLVENLRNVQEKIAAACQRVGRDPREVTLVAVSKTKPLADIETLIPAGQMDYGENYVQELVGKYEQVSRPVRWHMIGHLQRNKVKYIIDKVELIHPARFLFNAGSTPKQWNHKILQDEHLLGVDEQVSQLSASHFSQLK